MMLIEVLAFETGLEETVPTNRPPHETYTHHEEENSEISHEGISLRLHFVFFIFF